MSVTMGQHGPDILIVPGSLVTTDGLGQYTFEFTSDIGAGDHIFAVESLQGSGGSDFFTVSGLPTALTLVVDIQP